MLFIVFFLSLANAHGGCGNPPQGQFGAAWWREYKAWCRGCGGTICEIYNDCNGQCTQGSNGGGGSSGSSGPDLSGLPVTDQIMLNVMQEGVKELFRPPTPQELEARRQREWAAEQARLAAEAERLRLIKEKNDKMDAEASQTLSLMGPATSGHTSDEDLLKETPPVAAPPEEEKFNCGETGELIARLEGQGLKRMDIDIGKTRKMIKQAQEGSAAADKEAAGLAADLVAGKLAEKLEDFVKNQKTILAMEKQLQGLRAHTSVTSADADKLKLWIEEGVKGGNGVIDVCEKAKAAKEFNFSDPKNAPRREQILTALSEFNAKFMADTGAWEMAGEHLSKTLGPAGPVAFKTAVLGIKVAVNRGNKRVAEGDLNEQKYHLGNMMKTRAEMAQRAKDLKKQMNEKCKDPAESHPSR